MKILLLPAAAAPVTVWACAPAASKSETANISFFIAGLEVIEGKGTVKVHDYREPGLVIRPWSIAELTICTQFDRAQCGMVSKRMKLQRNATHHHQACTKLLRRRSVTSL
ncbi:MAG: hypothetical protein ACYCSR_12645 [Thiomonas sp.]